MHKPTARYLSRSLAIQAIYYYHYNISELHEIEEYLKETSPAVYKRANHELMRDLILKAIAEYDIQLELYNNYLLRDIVDIGMVEKIILVIGATELKYHLQTPAVILINEYVELAKLYGASDAYKFINSLLDKVAKDLRGAF